MSLKKSLVDKTQKIQNIPEHPKSQQTKERDALNLFERIGEYIDECFQVVSKWFPSGFSGRCMICFHVVQKSKNPKRVCVDKRGQPFPLVQKGLLID